MQFSKNTSSGNSKSLLIKIVVLIIIFVGTTVLLGKIEFPFPNKDIEKIIPNEKLKIVK
jgi:hypothetical protein